MLSETNSKIHTLRMISPLKLHITNDTNAIGMTIVDILLTYALTEQGNTWIYWIVTDLSDENAIKECIKIIDKEFLEASKEKSLAPCLFHDFELLKTAKDGSDELKELYKKNIKLVDELNINRDYE